MQVTWSPAAIDGGSPRTSYRVWAYEAPNGDEPYDEDVVTPIEMDPIPTASATPPATSHQFCNDIERFSRYRFVVADVNDVDIGELSDPSNAVTVYDPGTRFVSNAGNDGGNACTSPSTPCATIQRALEVSGNGEDVAVAQGNYGPFVVSGRAPEIIGGFDPQFTRMEPLTGGTAESSTTRVTAGAQLVPPPSFASAQVAISVRSTSGATTIRNLVVRHDDVSASTTTSGVEIHSSGNQVSLQDMTISGGNSSSTPTGVLVSGSSQVSITASR